ncbi:MAG: hypothetical protein ACYDHY_09750 [Acidiferrobacterales bacterium]
MVVAVKHVCPGCEQERMVEVCPVHEARIVQGARIVLDSAFCRCQTCGVEFDCGRDLDPDLIAAAINIRDLDESPVYSDVSHWDSPQEARE